MAYSDEVSDFLGITSSCGNIVYTLYDIDENQVNPRDSIVKVKSFGGSNNFYLQLDTTDWHEAGTYNFTMVVSLGDWPEVNPIETKFAVVVSPLAPMPIIFPEVVLFTSEREIVYEIVEPRIREAQDILADKIRFANHPVSLDGLIPLINKMTQTGEIEIKFTKQLTEISDEINLKTLQYEVEEGVWKPVLEVLIEPSVEQDAENCKMTWSIKELTLYKMVIQVDYETPLFISYGLPDFAVVNFADPELWVSSTGI